MSLHWKHMVKLKCVIYLGLRVATEEHAHTCACTRVHRGAHTPLTGCNLPGAYGWPSIPLHLSYTKTAQTQFTLPAGDGESETNFTRPADRGVRNHTLTEMLEMTERELRPCTHARGYF